MLRIADPLPPGRVHDLTVALHLVDVSRYQIERSNPLDLAKAQTAGYRIANVALTGGRGYVSGEWARTYLRRAQDLGMGRSCYHWLDGRTPGAAQAAAQLSRMRNVFGSTLTGFAHFVDVEETGTNGIAPPTWVHVRDYVTAVQQTFGRPIGIYSGDWYWPARWNGAGLTEYLMSAPNDPIPGPPADDDASWAAGWGGWAYRSIMQWAAERPLPGTGNCSLSVIRDHAVWLTLTGGDVVAPRDASAWVLIPCLVKLRDEFNAVSPKRSKGSDGSIGDSLHTSASDHTPDEDSDALRNMDADNLNEVHALDIDSTGPWPQSFGSYVLGIVARHRAGLDDRLQYVIFNRKIYSRSWGWAARDYTGEDPHTNHAHFSARYTTAQESDTRPWGLLEADDMTPAEMDALADKTASRVWGYFLGQSGPTAGVAVQSGYGLIKETSSALELTAESKAIQVAISAQAAAIVAAIRQLPSIDLDALSRVLAPVLAVAMAPMLPGGSSLTPSDVEGALRNVLTRGTDNS